MKNSYLASILRLVAKLQREVWQRTAISVTVPGLASQLPIRLDDELADVDLVHTIGGFEVANYDLAHAKSWEVSVLPRVGQSVLDVVTYTVSNSAYASGPIAGDFQPADQQLTPNLLKPAPQPFVIHPRGFTIYAASTYFDRVVFLGTFGNTKVFTHDDAPEPPPPPPPPPPTSAPRTELSETNDYVHHDIQTPSMFEIWGLPAFEVVGLDSGGRQASLEVKNIPQRFRFDDRPIHHSVFSAYLYLSALRDLASDYLNGRWRFNADPVGVMEMFEAMIYFGYIGGTVDPVDHTKYRTTIRVPLAFRDGWYRIGFSPLSDTVSWRHSWFEQLTSVVNPFLAPLDLVSAFNNTFEGMRSGRGLYNMRFSWGTHDSGRESVDCLVLSCLAAADLNCSRMPPTFTLISLLKAYKRLGDDGAQVLNEGGSAILGSPRRLVLDDGTILRHRHEAAPFEGAHPAVEIFRRPAGNFDHFACVYTGVVK